jgi:hypothetical protein
MHKAWKFKLKDLSVFDLLFLRSILLLFFHLESSEAGEYSYGYDTPWSSKTSLSYFAHDFSGFLPLKSSRFGDLYHVGGVFPPPLINFRHSFTPYEYNVAESAALREWFVWQNLHYAGASSFIQQVHYVFRPHSTSMCRGVTYRTPLKDNSEVLRVLPLVKSHMDRSKSMLSLYQRLRMRWRVRLRRLFRKPPPPLYFRDFFLGMVLFELWLQFVGPSYSRPSLEREERVWYFFDTSWLGSRPVALITKYSYRTFFVLDKYRYYPYFMFDRAPIMSIAYVLYNYLYGFLWTRLRMSGSTFFSRYIETKDWPKKRPRKFRCIRSTAVRVNLNLKLVSKKKSASRFLSKLKKRKIFRKCRWWRRRVSKRPRGLIPSYYPKFREQYDPTVPEEEFIEDDRNELYAALEGWLRQFYWANKRRFSYASATRPLTLTRKTLRSLFDSTIRYLLKQHLSNVVLTYRLSTVTKQLLEWEERRGLDRKVFLKYYNYNNVHRPWVVSYWLLKFLICRLANYVEFGLRGSTVRNNADLKFFVFLAGLYSVVNNSLNFLWVKSHFYLLLIFLKLDDLTRKLVLKFSLFKSLKRFYLFFFLQSYFLKFLLIKLWNFVLNLFWIGYLFFFLLFSTLSIFGQFYVLPWVDSVLVYFHAAAKTKFITFVAEVYYVFLPYWLKNWYLTLCLWILDRVKSPADEVLIHWSRAPRYRTPLKYTLPSTLYQRPYPWFLQEWFLLFGGDHNKFHSHELLLEHYLQEWFIWCYFHFFVDETLAKKSPYLYWILANNFIFSAVRIIFLPYYYQALNVLFEVLCFFYLGLWIPICFMKLWLAKQSVSLWCYEKPAVLIVHLCAHLSTVLTNYLIYSVYANSRRFSSLDFWLLRSVSVSLYYLQNSTPSGYIWWRAFCVEKGYISFTLSYLFFSLWVEWSFFPKRRVVIFEFILSLFINLFYNMLGTPFAKFRLLSFRMFYKVCHFCWALVASLVGMRKFFYFFFAFRYSTILYDFYHILLISAFLRVRYFRSNIIFCYADSRLFYQKFLLKPLLGVFVAFFSKKILPRVVHVFSIFCVNFLQFFTSIILFSWVVIFWSLILVQQVRSLIDLIFFVTMLRSVHTFLDDLGGFLFMFGLQFNLFFKFFICCQNLFNYEFLLLWVSRDLLYWCTALFEYWRFFLVFWSSWAFSPYCHLFNGLNRLCLFVIYRALLLYVVLLYLVEGSFSGFCNSVDFFFRRYLWFLGVFFDICVVAFVEIFSAFYNYIFSVRGFSLINFILLETFTLYPVIRSVLSTLFLSYTTYYVRAVFVPWVALAVQVEFGGRFDRFSMWRNEWRAWLWTCRFLLIYALVFKLFVYLIFFGNYFLFSLVVYFCFFFFIAKWITFVDSDLLWAQPAVVFLRRFGFIYSPFTWLRQISSTFHPITFLLFVFSKIFMHIVVAASYFFIVFHLRCTRFLEFYRRILPTFSPWNSVNLYTPPAAKLDWFGLFFFRLWTFFARIGARWFLDVLSGVAQFFSKVWVRLNVRSGVWMYTLFHVFSSSVVGWWLRVRRVSARGVINSRWLHAFFLNRFFSFAGIGKNYDSIIGGLSVLNYFVVNPVLFEVFLLFGLISSRDYSNFQTLFTNISSESFISRLLHFWNDVFMEAKLFRTLRSAAPHASNVSIWKFSELFSGTALNLTFFWSRFFMAFMGLVILILWPAILVVSLACFLFFLFLDLIRSSLLLTFHTFVCLVFLAVPLSLVYFGVNVFCLVFYVIIKFGVMFYFFARILR